MGSQPAKPFNKDIADEVLERIAGSSLSLANILAEKTEYPKITTFFKWLNTNEEFAKDYARAKECQAEYMAEEILMIADDGSNDYMTITKGDNEYNVEDREVTNRSKLRVDARKWLASKLLPKKFGDKVDVTSGGDPIKSAIPEIVVYNQAPPLAASEDEIQGHV